MQEQEAVAPAGQGGGAEEQLHVAGILVHVAPAHEEAVKSWIATLPGAQLHGAAQGKLVVTLEACSSMAIIDRLSLMRDRPGVLSALSVYQHNEPAAQIDQEESYGN